MLPVGTGIVGLLLGAGLGGNTGTTTAAAPTVTVTQFQTVDNVVTETVTETAVATPTAVTATIPGDGTFIVGTDIKPGTYKAPAPASGNCYWARLKGDGGGLGNIIANNNSSGPSVVTIRKSDKQFETSGCEEWMKVK